MAILTNASVFNPETMKMEKWTAISIEEGKIKRFYNEPVELGSDLIDCTKLYLIPGLIDSHIHFFQSGGLYTRPDVIDLRQTKSYEEEQKWIRENLAETFKRYLASGVTSVVDCGGPFWNFEVRRQSGNPLTPRIEVAGPLISTVSRPQLDLGDPPIIQTETPEKAVALVQRLAKHNPAFVKIWFILRENSFDMDTEIVKTAIEESHKLGLRVAVHATELKTAKVAVKLGADILVHSVFDQEVDDEFIQSLVDQQVIYIPTLIVRTGYRDVLSKTPLISSFEETWGDPEIISSWFEMFQQEDIKRAELTPAASKNLKRLADAGVTIATGTDAGNIGTLHGSSIHREMEEMVRAGMSPAQVLQASTLNAAKVFGDPSLGIIAEGVPANIIALSRDPLNDIAATTSIEFVIHEGKLIRPLEIIFPNRPEWIIDQLYYAFNSPGSIDLKKLLHPNAVAYRMNSDEVLAKGYEGVMEALSQFFGRNGRITLHSRIPLKNMIMDRVFPLASPHSPQNIYYEIRMLRINAIWLQ